MAKKKRAKASKRRGRRRRGRTVKKVNFQRGKTTVPVDKRYDALPPGKRISRNGKVYWETRKNRSDLRGRV